MGVSDLLTPRTQKLRINQILHIALFLKGGTVSKKGGTGSNFLFDLFLEGSLPDLYP